MSASCALRSPLLPPARRIGAVVLGCALSWACATTPPAPPPAPTVEPAPPPEDDTPSAAPPVSVQVGRPAPWIAAFDLDGNPRSLASTLESTKARAVLVHVWSAGMDTGLEALGQWTERLAKARVGVLLVNAGDAEDTVRLRLSEVGLSGVPCLLDQTGAVRRSVGLSGDEGVPSPGLTLLVKRNQNVQWLAGPLTEGTIRSAVRPTGTTAPGR